MTTRGSLPERALEGAAELRGRGSRSISSLVATVLLLATTIAIIVAVVSWLMGLFAQTTRVEIYQRYTLILQSPSTVVHMGLPGYALVDAWSSYDASAGAYRVYFRVTAVRELSYIRVEASVRCCGGRPPPGVLNPDILWEDYNVHSGWYSEQYWEPITVDEYPVYIYVHLWIREES